MSGEHAIVAALAAKEGQREQHGCTALTPQLVLFWLAALSEVPD